MIETNLKGNTPDIAEENIQKLKQIFPDVFTEDKVDFEKLQQVLGDYVEDGNERYNFTWNGKGRALRLSQTPSLGTLRPSKEESKDWDDTKNLYIEGDNLEVLKLLQKSYHSKVKMIYIDPPYNTGKDFVYPDDFHDSLENYKKLTGQVDNEGNRISTNTEASGRYHTDWLNMMYPRLRLARNLLTDDGVIFISIDDNEVDNLKKICNEVFGEDNFEAQFYIKVRHENRILREDIRYQLVMEHVLCYKKETYYPNRRPKEKNSENDYTFDIQILGSPKDILKIGSFDVEIYSRNDYKISKSENGSLKEYQIRGSLISQSGSASEYYEKNLRNRKDIDGEGTLYKVIGMGLRGDGLGYRYIRQPDDFKFKNGFYYQGRPINQTVSKGLPFQNYYDFVTETNNVGYEGEVDFKNGKKPLALLYKIFEICGVAKNDIILDFFSGSSTTAHAVMQLNAEDGGNRKFIMVQLPEPTDDPEFTNICEIGKERIRRAGEKIKEEKGLEAQGLDIGFKVLKLDTSNIRKWQPDYDNLEQSILDYVDNYVDGRTELDVVYEIMIKYGLDLDYPVDEFIIAQKKVYSIGFGMLMICLDNEITTEVAKGILEKVKELAPESTRVVFKDNGFKTDSNKTNIKEILKCGGIEEFITL